MLVGVGAVFWGSGPAAGAQETFGASNVNIGDLVSVDSLAGSEMSGRDRVPATLLQLSSQFSSVLWIELESGVLHLLRRQGNDHTWRSVLSRPVSIGKAGSGKQLEGDNKTPIGIYSVYDFIGDEKLIDFYGVGAFPLSYPNEWDRRLGRTGSGIWLHGLPKSVGNRPRLDSEGCVVIDNKTLEWMMRHLEPENTRVVLGPKIRWVNAAKSQRLRASLNQRFQDWLRAWSALDTEAYLNFYHPDFTTGKKNFAQWARYKRGVNRSKQWAKVSAQDVNFLCIREKANCWRWNINKTTAVAISNTRVLKCCFGVLAQMMNGGSSMKDRDDFEQTYDLARHSRACVTDHRQLHNSEAVNAKSRAVGPV